MTRRTCARCRFTFGRDQLLHSKHTDNYYCMNEKECRRRTNNDLTDEELLQLMRETEKLIKTL